MPETVATDETELNRKVVSQLLDAIHTMDVAGVLDLFDPAVVMHEPPNLPFSGVYHGVEGIAELMGKLLPVVNLSGVEVETMTAGADWVILLTHIPLQTGDARIDLSECFRLADGKIVEIRVFYWDTTVIPEESPTT